MQNMLLFGVAGIVLAFLTAWGGVVLLMGDWETLDHSALPLDKWPLPAPVAWPSKPAKIVMGARYLGYDTYHYQAGDRSSAVAGQPLIVYGMQYTMSGLPFRAFESARLSEIDGVTRKSLRHHRHKGEWVFAIPYMPLWPGFLANAFLYGALAAALSWVARASRRAWRNRASKRS